MKILLIDVYNFNKGGAETVCFNTVNCWRNMGTKSFTSRLNGKTTAHHLSASISPNQRKRELAR